MLFQNQEDGIGTTLCTPAPPLHSFPVFFLFVSVLILLIVTPSNSLFKKSLIGFISKNKMFIKRKILNAGITANRMN